MHSDKIKLRSFLTTLYFAGDVGVRHLIAGNNLMEKILVQLKRLQRHYEHSVKTYDDASLLDLAHILRIWTELKPVLSDTYPNFKIKKPFKTGSPIRKVLKQAANSQYIFSYLPGDGVVTYASNGQLASGPDIDNGGNFTMGVKVKNTGSSVWLSQYCYISKSLEQPHIKALDNEKVVRCNYGNWMGSETVRVQFLNANGVMEKLSISREILIKRVANILDGSHTSLNNSDSSDNMFDESVKWLMRFSCGGLPLPYFLLLKIAQDIISNAPKLLGVEEHA